MSLATAPAPVGELLRSWRQRRSLSQLELALDADVSARHVSFLETGRSRPSREMVLHLAEHLEVPLRERNGLLLAAGYAPLYGESSLETDEMTPVRQALDRFLRAHEPYPALVIDRHHNLLAANDALAIITEGVARSRPLSCALCHKDTLADCATVLAWRSGRPGRGWPRSRRRSWRC